MATHSSILPGDSHGERSLADYSPWGNTLGMTEVAAYRVHAHKINQPLTSGDKQAAKSWDPLPWPSASSCPLHAPQQKEKREASHKAISSAPAQATGSTQSCPLESCGGFYKLWGLPLPWSLGRGRCK